MFVLARHILALFRLLIFLSTTVVLGVVQLVWRAVSKDAYFIPSFFQKLMCVLLGIKVTVKGKPIDKKPVMVMANHLSWADILVIGSVMQCRFVAKKEVASWPVFNILAYLQNSVFIERDRRGTKEGTDRLAKTMLSDPRAYVLFPEGTNSYTLGAFLPFKSSYFSIPETYSAVAIQPVALNVRAVEGRKVVTQADYQLYAWGDESFVGHLWRFFMHVSHEIELTYCDEIDTRGKDRKQLALETERAVFNQQIHSLQQS